MPTYTDLEYKGYHTVVEHDIESNTLRGKIEGISDYVDFQCDDPIRVEKEFHDAVDDYLIFREEVRGECGFPGDILDSDLKPLSESEFFDRLEMSRIHASNGKTKEAHEVGENVRKKHGLVTMNQPFK